MSVDYVSSSQAVKCLNYQTKKNNDQVTLTRLGDAAKELATLAETVEKVSTESKSNYGYYLSSNEMFTEARKKLTPGNKVHDVQPTAHFGFSTWHNFEIVGLSKSQLMVIADFSSIALEFLKKSVDLLKKCPTSKEFKETILLKSYGSEMPIANSKYKHLKLYPERATENPHAAFKAELELENWLKDPKIYKHIRKLSLTNRIVLIRMDAFNDGGLFSQIRAVFNKHKIHLGTLYISNVINNIGESMDENIDQFEGSVDELAEKDTQIIQSTWIDTGMSDKKMLKQFVHNDKADLRRIFHKTEGDSFKPGEIDSERSFFASPSLRRELFT